MTRPLSFSTLAALALGVVACNFCVSEATAGTSVITYHNDNNSSGQNLTETHLTPSNVKYANFGKVYAAAVDGQVYAQPLYVPALAITAGTYKGTTHDTAFVCTQHDSVYAIDAASGTQLWTTSLINVAGGESTMPNGDSNTNDINPEIGITSTPTIDVAADANKKRYIYVVAKSKLVINNVGHYYFKLHALDIASGVERAGSPVVIGETAYPSQNTYTYISGPSVAGGGSGSINNVLTFNAMREHQRPALTIVGGRLYLAFASHGDSGPYHGWVLGYNPSTLALTGVFCDSPTGYNGGIWQAGGRVAADANGALYVISGNGEFANVDPNTEPVVSDFDANGFPANHCYGDSMIKLVVDNTTASNPNSNGWGLKVADYFTPYNQETLNLGDTDYGSGGAMIFPDTVGSAAHPHLIIGAGKEGRLYLIDRDNMGKFRGGITGSGSNAAFVSDADAIVQSAPPNTISGSLDTPGYFNGQFYYAAAYSNDHGKAFTIKNGQINFTPSSMSTDTFGYLGSSPSISASNATTNGIVWCVDRGTNQLRAYDATDLSTELYNSSQAPNTRDQLGTASKFGVATVADGRVLLGTSEPAGPSALVCYGIMTAATTPPAQPSNLYAQTVSGGEIDLFWDDNANNETGYEVYVSLDPNNFPTNPRATTGVDGNSAIINGLQVSTTYYFRVRAVNTIGGSAYSNIAATTSGVAPPVDFSSGFANAANMITFDGYTSGTSPIVGSVLRLTDGSSGEAHAVWMNTMQNISKFSTEFTFVTSNATADGFTFCLQASGLTALGVYGGGLGYQGISSSAAVKFDLYPTSSTTGLYYNGVAPDDSTTPTASSSGSIDTSTAGLDFHDGHVLRVILRYDGTTLFESVLDTTTRLEFTHSYKVNLPSIIGSTKAYIGFTGATGGLVSQQDVREWSFTTNPPTTPNAPSNLTAAAGSATQVNLSWKDNATNETSTRVERAPSGGAFAVVGSVGANATSYVDAALSSKTTYTYRVIASNNGLDSAASKTVTITTPVPPTTPSGATPTLVAANEVDFTWNDNSNNETGFRILRSQDDSEFKVLATLPANTTSYKDKTVTGSTDYGYHVQAYNAAGYVDFTGFNTTTPAGINIVAGSATAQEGSKVPASITIRRTTADEDALTVKYTILSGSGQAKYGTRYSMNPAPTSASGGSVTIPAKGLAATITITAVNDGAITGPQSVTLTLAKGTGYTIIGSNSATVTILDTPINDWKVKNFGSAAKAQSAEAADTADPDGDGLNNLMEYALGSNPLENSASRAPVVEVESIGGKKYLTLTFYTTDPQPSDIIYAPQYATGLPMSWVAAEIVSGYPVVHNNGYLTVKFRSPDPITSTSAPGYMRLVISRH